MKRPDRTAGGILDRKGNQLAAGDKVQHSTARVGEIAEIKGPRYAVLWTDDTQAHWYRVNLMWRCPHLELVQGGEQG